MPLADNLSKTLQGLETDDVITTTQDRDGKVSTIELSASERARGQENFDFYCFLIWPFIEATWLGAVSLLMLTPPATGPSLSPSATKQSGSEWLDLKQVQDRAQLLGKTLYHQGDLSYFEAVNKETLKNAYTRFEEEGIISVSRSRDSKVPAKVRLDKEWMPVRDAQRAIKAEGKLWEFCESISRSRREGKNRRDGATVRGRVLGLVELVGGPLWEVAGAEGRSSGLVEGEERKRRARRKPMQTKARL